MESDPILRPGKNIDPLVVFYTDQGNGSSYILLIQLNEDEYRLIYIEHYIKYYMNLLKKTKRILFCYKESIYSTYTVKNGWCRGGLVAWVL
jgi:hypothetical protein